MPNLENGICVTINRKSNSVSISSPNMKNERSRLDFDTFLKIQTKLRSMHKKKNMQELKDYFSETLKDLKIDQKDLYQSSSFKMFNNSPSTSSFFNDKKKQSSIHKKTLEKLICFLSQYVK